MNTAHITIRYAGSSVSFNVGANEGIGSILNSSRVREDPTMSFGDKYRILQNGIETSSDSLVSDGAVYTIEQVASTKG